MKRVLLFFILSLSAVFANAGPITTGGGDIRCAEFSDLARKLASALSQAGQIEVNKIDPKIRVLRIEEISSELRCLPVKVLDREARSYPSEMRIDLLVDRWDDLTAIKKLRLVAHELAVLAEYEAEGEYSVSENILNIAKEHSQFIRNSLSASTTITNPDKSVTLFNPTIEYKGMPRHIGFIQRIIELPDGPMPYPEGNAGDEALERKARAHAEGACKYFGYSIVKAYSYSSKDVSGMIYCKIDTMGNLAGCYVKNENFISQAGYPNIFVVRSLTSVSCSP